MLVGEDDASEKIEKIEHFGGCSGVVRGLIRVQTTEIRVQTTEIRVQTTEISPKYPYISPKYPYIRPQKDMYEKHRKNNKLKF